MSNNFPDIRVSELKDINTKSAYFVLKPSGFLRDDGKEINGKRKHI